MTQAGKIKSVVPAGGLWPPGTPPLFIQMIGGHILNCRQSVLLGPAGYFGQEGLLGLARGIGLCLEPGTRLVAAAAAEIAILPADLLDALVEVATEIGHGGGITLRVFSGGTPRHQCTKKYTCISVVQN